MSQYEEGYKGEVSRALEKCQFIEQTLKECLLSAIEIAQIQESQHCPIRYKASKISELPLGPLIQEFAKINEDTGLHEDLWEFKDKRNKVAHQSRLFTIGELEDEAHMLGATLEMKRITDRATEIHHKLLAFRYHLIRILNETKRQPKR